MESPRPFSPIASQGSRPGRFRPLLLRIAQLYRHGRPLALPSSPELGERGPLSVYTISRRLIKAAAAALFLNLLLAAEVPLFGMSWGSLLRLSSEAIGLVLGMCLLVRPGRPFRPAVYAALTAAVILLKLFQSADRLVPLVFNREFNLFFDSQRLPDLILLFRLTRPPAVVLMGLAGTLAAMAALAWGVWRALKALHRGLAGRSPAPARVRLPAAALAIAILAAAAGAPTAWWDEAVLPRVAREVRFILNLDETRERHRAGFQQAIERARRTATDLGRLNRASVFLVVVESYGMSALSDPRHAETVLPAIRAAEAELRSAGFEMGSAYLTSPTFGGGSWLAHATLASGVRIEDQVAHDLLLASDLLPVAEYFNRSGYRTLRAMPGTLWPWPEGEFYRFHRTYIAPDFGYRGPSFGFAPMPDQFVLDWVARHEVRKAPGPLFVELILTGSHAAFDLQAPYLDDWERIGDGSVFHALAPVRFPVGWDELAMASPGYSAAIAHEITLLKDFILRFLEREELVVIVGDHQPCVELVGADQPWSVPVHVVSRNAGLVREFTRRGYTAGLIPDPQRPHPGMETLFWDLLEGFSGDQEEPEKKEIWERSGSKNFCSSGE